MEQNSEYIIHTEDIEMICPYCGKDLEEVDGKLYCDNCGVREI